MTQLATSGRVKFFACGSKATPIHIATDGKFIALLSTDFMPTQAEQLGHNNLLDCEFARDRFTALSSITSVVIPANAGRFREQTKFLVVNLHYRAYS
jgi:hypothetical protein